MKPQTAVLAGLAFGFVMSLLYSLMTDLSMGLYMGLLSGAAFGMMIYFFVNSKQVTEQTLPTKDLAGDVIHSGPANHFKGREAVGGKLYLTDKELYFKSHKFNLQNHEWSILIAEINKLEPKNTLRLVPNGIVVIDNAGNREQFVLQKRALWMEKIEEVRRAYLN